ncbi:hypothetical protein GCM10027436_16050 [Actinophytocola sediminis]
MCSIVVGRFCTTTSSFRTLDNLRAATIEELAAIDGVRCEKARAIHAGLRANTDVLGRLVAAGITTEVEQPPTATSLAGKTVVITGTVPGLRRTEVHDAAIQLGATRHRLGQQGHRPAHRRRRVLHPAASSPRHSSSA